MKNIELKLIIKSNVSMDDIIDALQNIAPVELYWIRKEQSKPVPIESSRLVKRRAAQPSREKEERI